MLALLLTKPRHTVAASLFLLACACGPDGPSTAGDDDDDATAPTGEGCFPPCEAATSVCVDGACVSCAPSLAIPYAIDAAAPVFVGLDPVDGPFEERRLRMRPFTVSGPATITVEGEAAELYDDAGAVLPSLTELPAGEHNLYLRGIATGEAELLLSPAGTCAEGGAAVPLRVGPEPGLAGRAVDGFPHFEPTRAVNADVALQGALDPSRYADRVGAPYDVYVVPHRSPAEWAADPALADLGDGASGTVTAGSVADNVLELWAPPLDAGPDVTTGYDIVYDFGGDGTLDPGDLIDGFDAPGFHAVIDLNTPGPHTVASFQYSADYWNTMRVYAPDPPVGGHPLVVISHGNGHDYTWYDYLGNHLASWGYVVIAHRNDTVPGPVTAAVTTFTNTETFLRDVPTMGGGLLAGMVDGSRISWIGHSRGGEGVVIAYDKVFTGAVTPQQFTAADVVLVSSIAPTLFEGPDVANPNDVPYHLLAGSADGDVTGGVDCDLCQYFRIFQRGTGPLLATYVQGATHNDFNCCGVNDGAWMGGQGQKIGRERAQRIAKAYYLALLEHYVNGDEALADYLGRMPEGFRPIGANAFIATQYKLPADADKLVLDDFQSEPDPAVSSSGGTVSWTVENLVEGALDDANNGLSWNGADPMNGMSQSHGDPQPARGAVFDFPPGGDLWLELEVPAGSRDVSRFGHLSFRACQGTRHPYTEALDDMLSFSAVLVDGAGVERSVDFGVYGRITEPYERTDGTGGSGWVNEFQTVRIPLSAFATDGSGLDLSDIVAVRFDFGAAHGSEQGRVGLDDIEFVE